MPEHNWKRYDLLGKCSNPTHIQYKGEEISEETFEYKGCWNCEFFDMVIISHIMM